MDIEKFKKESKVTYVYVIGKVIGFPIMKSISDNDKYFYRGYIEIPYSYADFSSFSKEQQKAVCESVFCKSGFLISVSSCNKDMFYVKTKDAEYELTISNIKELLSKEPNIDNKNKLKSLIEEIRKNKDDDKDYVKRIIKLANCFVGNTEFTDIQSDHILYVVRDAIDICDDKGSSFNGMRNELNEITKSLFHYDIESKEIISED